MKIKRNADGETLTYDVRNFQPITRNRFYPAFMMTFKSAPAAKCGLLITTRIAVLCSLLLWCGPLRAEYCLDWSAFVSKHSGSSGHCWASENECNTYRMSRPSGDYVGGCYFKPGKYPRTGQEKSQTKPAEDKAAAELLKKQQAAKQKQAEQEKQRTASDRQQLLDILKDAGSVTPERTIVLKPVPPTGGNARSQLDCAGNNAALPPEETRDSWEARAKDCSPVTPDVPEAGAPVPAEGRTNGVPQ